MSDTLTSAWAPTAGASTSWLEGVRVRCSHRSTALDVAGRLLAQFGAYVEYDSDSGAFDKMGALAGFDVVLVDRIESESGPLSVSELGVDEYLESVRAHGAKVWVTASAFGLVGSEATSFASEVTLLAAAGILGHSRPSEDLPPTIPAAPIGLRLVGTVIAVAALHALHEFRSTNLPVHVDLSAQGAVMATGLTLELGHALANAPDQGGSARYGAPTGMFACTDGDVYVVVLEEHQWKGIQGVLSPALDHIESMEAARSLPSEINAAVAAWSAGRTRLAAESALQAAGVPCTSVNTVAEFLDRAVSSGRTVAVSGPDAAILPARVRAGATRGLSDSPLTLSELRVLDAGHVLAVPLASAWLGAMGAQVAKLEDPDRLDVYRRRGPFAAGIAGVNRSAYFNHINFCKSSLDLTLDADMNAANIATFDVVINNLSPHRARRIGVDAGSIDVDSKPKLILASSGFGQDGDLADYRAYGTNIHAFSGLVAATRDATGNMAGVGTPWADPLTSVAIAAWVLAWTFNVGNRTDTSIDLSMAEVMAAQLSELVQRTSEEQYALSAGMDFFVQPTASAEILAVSLDANDVEEFEQITGLTTSALRRRGQSLTDTSGRSVQRLEHLLRESGIRAARVRTAADLAVDPVFVETGLFQSVSSDSMGSYLVTGLPWRIVGAGSPKLTAAPERPAARC